VRRAVGIALAIVVALVFLNDVGRWVNAQSRLNESTTELADWAAENVSSGTRDLGAPVVISEGARRGLRVYRYDQDEFTVSVWASADVPGTWVVGPYVAVLDGKPLEQALSVPFVVRSYQQARHQ
jgi:hypothetical protein